jgi:hypothetical protein
LPPLRSAESRVVDWLKERLTDAWERAFPEPLSLGARVAGGFFVAYAVLSAASAWLLVPEAAKGLRVGLFAAALVDALLGLALLAGRERAHRSAAVRLGIGTLGLCFLARGEPVLIGTQVLLASGFLLLLLGEPDRRRGTAGVLVLLLLLVPLTTQVAAPYTQSTPLAELLLELRGGLEPARSPPPGAPASLPTSSPSPARVGARPGTRCSSAGLRGWTAPGSWCVTRRARAGRWRAWCPSSRASPDGVRPHGRDVPHQ